MNNSLRNRQLVSGFTIIFSGVVIVGLLLGLNIYQQRTKSIKSELEHIALDLLGFVEYQKNKFTIPSTNGDQFILDNRLRRADRQRFAYIWDSDQQKMVWNSVDNDDVDQATRADFFALFDFGHLLKKQDFKTYRPPKAEQLSSIADPGYPEEVYMVASQVFRFRPAGSANPHQYIFVVAESIDSVSKELKSFLKTFIAIFFLSVLLIVIAQIASSIWVTNPIREFEAEVRDIEMGKKESIEYKYPEELRPIKTTINALIGQEKGQKQRYKDKLDDLAHSLKTPLAAMRMQLNGNQFEDLPPNHPGIKGLHDEIDNMQTLITRQLRAAAVTQSATIIMAQPIKPILDRLVPTLRKAFQLKDITIEANVNEFLKCRLNNEDLLELFGNLASNACKHCDTKVRITADYLNDMLEVNFDDDGPGFPKNNPERLLQRGIRKDSETEGQGLGLAISTEIVSAVNGSIQLLESPMGGGRVQLLLPA